MRRQPHRLHPRRDALVARIASHPVESLGVDQHDPNAMTFGEPQKILSPPIASLAVEEDFLHGGRVLAQAAHHRVKTVDDADISHSVDVSG
jgi:hypothetical protein